MGKDKTSTSSSGGSSSQTTYTPTAEETEMNKLALERERANQSGLMGMQSAALGLGTNLLQGQNLPGYLQKLPYGISPEVTTMLVNQSLGDMNAQLAKSGAGTFMESGASQAIGTRTAGDIRMGAEEWNLGNLQNLLSLALSGQAQVQYPIMAQSTALGSRLAGLRSSATSGTYYGNQTTTAMNPFLKSYEQQLGTSLGKSTSTGLNTFLSKLT